MYILLKLIVENFTTIKYLKQVFNVDIKVVCFIGLTVQSSAILY